MERLHARDNFSPFLTKDLAMPALYLIERRIEIDAAHRAAFDGTKCSNLHGHRYAVLASCVGPMIEEGLQKGMVLDFGILKKIMKEEIDEPCDHAALLWVDDPMTRTFVCDDNILETIIKPAVLSKGHYRLETSAVGVLYILKDIPTAEALAAHWYHRMKPRIEALNIPDLRLHQVKVFESPQCMAAFPAIP